MTNTDKLKQLKAESGKTWQEVADLIDVPITTMRGYTYHRDRTIPDNLLELLELKLHV